MRVNGREGLGCVTALADVSGDTVTVEPLANLPVLNDLVADMAPFVERFPAPHPNVRESEFLPEADTPDDVEAYGRFEDCIECGLCLSACPVAATDDTYVGPAALAYAQRMLEEARGADREALLDWADSEAGAWRCHASFECTEACPSNVRPAQRIMALRKELGEPQEGVVVSVRRGTDPGLDEIRSAREEPARCRARASARSRGSTSAGAGSGTSRSR